MSLSRTATIVSWVAQIIVAAILAQTLFFKFTGAAESRYIFSTLGIEPWGRYASGVAELIAVMLLLNPRTAALGGLLAMGVISGAILSHLAKLGIEVQGDGGLLFGLACLVFVASAVVLFLRRGDLPIVGPALQGGVR
jgi:hypothetical protein